ncbi:Nif3-like dinuclear metal center hexameric protein [Sorangium cellulosum]|uniref:GTP cyclohydrolase 1 type 2 homolog n=1 Tax=Sorangium cellulosum TaxID=56 RepID=A0A2L0EXD5_SORCE|nr:Nif3-like dinuclear metal center hexameric protein [Sorangium cellulosum]AUX43958.1 Nif3-like dinuclear metal center hexameric protein [Sorangium cellulosum]
MTLLKDVLAALESIAPLRFAEPWDNVGLIAGDPARPSSAALLAIDYTPEVAREARELGCDLVVAYHPPLFEAVKRVVAPSPVFEAIRDGIALYSPHTALDVAEGGTNDVLGDALGLSGDRTPLRRATSRAWQSKLVVFVPEDHADVLADALADAGAGKIGRYSRCSFRTIGTGTFFGEEGTNPTVGEKGRLERVTEVRLEMVFPRERTEAVLQAMRAAHPYEEVAFDLIELAVEPLRAGIGRIGQLERPAPVGELLGRIKERLGVGALLVAGPEERDVARGATCAGAGGALLGEAIAQGAELYLTGELRHHDALRAANAGVTVVCALHSNSERAALKRLAERLRAEVPSLRVDVSARDRDPFAIR